MLRTLSLSAPTRSAVRFCSLAEDWYEVASSILASPLVRDKAVAVNGVRDAPTAFFIGYKAIAFSGIDGDCNADRRGVLSHPRLFYAWG